ncbi:right-handed parallel beta-helix repeat-containing protein [Bacillus altitudinis]|uniref:right-handed parallel beta-helix repeat-containing protein n=1 Tax=Bacillus altitudinis TaxID=293387 RepID=UPI001BD0A966|nr:right-handed parallel beta-helix repeat-containing protein [Bacillus altitudinis]MBS4747553.1 hypothetical protein [Bacillus altitudinis]
MAIENDLIPVNTLGVQDEETGKWIPVDAVALRSHTDRLTIEEILDEFSSLNNQNSSLEQSIGNIEEIPTPGNSLSEKFSKEIGQLFSNPMWYGAKGDGVRDDSKALQNALNNKGNIYMPKGKYLIKSTLVVLGNTRIVFHPEAEIIRGASIYCSFTNGYPEDKFLAYEGNGNIEILGGIIDIKGNEIKSNGGGIVFGHARNITIEGVTIKNPYNIHHIEINACENVMINKCSFLGYYHSGTRAFSEAIQIDLAKSYEVFPVFGSYDGTVCKNITIKHCVFNNVGAGIGTHNPAEYTFHENINILYNTFTNLLHHGVSGLIFKNFRINGNSFLNCYRGIYLAWSYDGKMDNNVIKDSSNHGVLIRKTNKVTINNITVSRAKGVGISIYEDSGTININQAHIEYGKLLGINIDCNTTTVNNCIIKYNNDNGIYIHNSATNNKIFGGSIYGNGKHGILITDDANSNQIKDVRIFANNQLNVNAGNVIILKNASKNRFESNTVRIGDMDKKPLYGLFIAGTCTDNIVLINDMKNSGTSYSYQSDSTSTVTQAVNIL